MQFVVGARVRTLVQEAVTAVVMLSRRNNYVIMAMVVGERVVGVGIAL